MRNQPIWKNLEAGLQPLFPAYALLTKEVPVMPSEEALAAGGISADQYRAIIANHRKD
jgi:hypothetical protein